MTHAAFMPENNDIVTIGDCTLYLGNCLELMPNLSHDVDVIVTDPPYGVGIEYEDYIDSKKNFRETIDAAIPIFKKISKFAVMPCGPLRELRQMYIDHSPDWLISWHKGSPGTRSPIGFNSWEPHVCWGAPTKAMHDAFTTRCGFEIEGHPCPKPIAYARWLVSRAATDTETVLDPFMGSGTTGVACAEQGKRFIGIELSRKYFDIATERISATYSQGRLF